VEPPSANVDTIDASHGTRGEVKTSVGDCSQTAELSELAAGSLDRATVRTFVAELVASGIVAIK
jgi:hypothetical protein